MPSRAVDFNTLPQATRERFIQCTRSQQMPQPILSDRLGTAGAAVGWGFLFVCAAGALLGVMVASFGRTDELGLQGPGFAVAYALLAFLAVYSILAIVRRSVLMRSVPYTPGRYIFPMDFVEATSNILKITPMASMVDFRGVHHHHNGVYTNTIFTFRFDDGTTQSMTIAGKQIAENALQTLQAQRGYVFDAIQAQDTEKLYALDIFFEARMNNWQPPPFAGPPAGPVAQPLPALLQKAALVALGAGLLLGPPAWFVRSMMSDAAAFANLEKYGSKYDIERYAERGGKRAKEAKEELLPRARLREVKNDSNPSVTKYREVATEFPSHAVATEARAEIAKLYAKNLADFHAQAANDPKMVSFMDKLFAYLQAHDTSHVVVRFGPPSATDLAKADAELNKTVRGGVVPIAGHFTEASSAKREEAIINILQGAFRQIFPADMFELNKGARLGQPFAEKVPTIEIEYEVRPSGSTYTSDKTHKNFVGIVVNFNVTARIPGEADTFSFKMTVEPPERFTVETSNTFGAYTGAADGIVYHTMATHAFKELATKMRGVFFRVGSAAFSGSVAGALGAGSGSKAGGDRDDDDHGGGADDDKDDKDPGDGSTSGGASPPPAAPPPPPVAPPPAAPRAPRGRRR
jgi:hypothetical protein